MSRLIARTLITSLAAVLLAAPALEAEGATKPGISSRLLSCTRTHSDSGNLDTFILKFQARARKVVSGQSDPVLKPLAGATIKAEMTGEADIVKNVDVDKTNARGIAVNRLTFHPRSAEGEDVYFMSWYAKKTGYRPDTDDAFLRSSGPEGGSCTA